MDDTSKDNTQQKSLTVLQELRQELIERSAGDQHFYVRVTAALDMAEEAVRQAQAELLRRQINIRTEQQVAKELECSLDTVRRARKRHNIPHVSAGTLIRYTDEQFLELLKAMERPAKLKEARVINRK